MNNLPAWDLGNGIWLLADQDFDYAALQEQNATMHEMARAMGLDNEDTGSTFTIDTNGLWLEITNVSSGLAYLNLNNATDSVYEILSKTDLTLTNWNIEQEVWPTNPAVMPFVVASLGRTNLFIWAQDWTGVTENENTTPDWWFWKYFGTLDLSDTNLDSTGTNTLLYDYQNGRDPNVIQFSLQFTNYYVNTLNVPVQLNISGGVPSYMAVLINDMNQADAVWQPYASSNIIVTLGPTNGAYSIYVGLRGLPPNAAQTWQLTSVTLYSAAPMLTITNPATSVVSQSPIQLQGFASNPLDSLTFNVSNAAGVLTNQPGFLTGQFYDTGLLAYTTNYFECSGIVLNSGTNIITLHATDWAGNTANVSFTVIYSPDTNPPVLNLVWPQDGTVISGSNFTLQAQVSDPTATVTASINGNAVQGLVEQSGSVWVQNLPLNAGTNAMTLTATNVFGVSVTDFNVIGNDVGLVIDPLPDDQLNQPLVTVTGSINDPSDTVTVNDVQANVDSETGYWEADGVPVNPTGTASLNVQVGDSSNNPLSSGMASQPQPATVVLASYSDFTSDQFTGFYGSGNWLYLNVNTINWAYDAGGTENGNWAGPNDAGIEEIYNNNSWSLPAAGPGSAGLGFTWDYFSVNTSYVDDYGTTHSFQHSSKAIMMLAPYGQEPAGTTNVYLFLAGFMEYTNPVQNGSANLSHPPEWTQINGQTLVNTGITNADGSVMGAMVVSAVGGTTVTLTPTITQYYTYNAASISDTQVLNLTLQIIDTNTGINLSAQTNTVIVGQQMNLTCQLSVTNQLMTNFPLANFQWTIPGVTISNYVEAADASSAMVVTSFPLNNSNVVFYWVDGASNRLVQCSATVQGKMVTGQAAFNVFRPTAKITTVTGTVALDTNWNNGYFALHYGYISEFGTPGIQFYSSITTNGCPGHIKWIQIINSLSDDVIATGGYYDVHLLLTNALDNADSYPYNTLTNAEDSPGRPVNKASDKSVSVSDNFSMWVEYQPPGGIWVPLSVVNWSWGGEGSTNGVNWSLISSNNIVNPTGFETTTFPTWNNIYKNP